MAPHHVKECPGCDTRIIGWLPYCSECRQLLPPALSDRLRRAYGPELDAAAADAVAYLAECRELAETERHLQRRTFLERARRAG